MAELFKLGEYPLITELGPKYKPTILEESNAQVSNLNDDLLLEELGSFHKQREMSKYCARKIVHEYRDSQTLSGSIDVSNYKNKLIKTLEYYLQIRQTECSGEIVRVNDEGIVGINIRVSDSTLRMLSLSDSIMIIAETINHELTHGNIYLHRNLNGQEINDQPNYYQAALNLKRDYCKWDENNKYGLFAYALYNTYYHERQAFISQFNVSLMSKNKGKMYINSDELRSNILSSRIYGYYKNNIEILTHFLMDAKDRLKLKDILSKYGIVFDDNQLLDKIKWMLGISEDTISQLGRNAMLAYK